MGRWVGGEGMGRRWGWHGEVGGKGDGEGMGRRWGGDGKVGGEEMGRWVGKGYCSVWYGRGRGRRRDGKVTIYNTAGPFPAAMGAGIWFGGLHGEHLHLLGDRQDFPTDVSYTGVTLATSAGYPPPPPRAAAGHIVLLKWPLQCPFEIH